MHIRCPHCEFEGESSISDKSGAVAGIISLIGFIGIFAYPAIAIYTVGVELNLYILFAFILMGAAGYVMVQKYRSCPKCEHKEIVRT